MAVSLFTTQTRRKFFRYALILFKEENTTVPLKTNLIVGYDESYYSVGDDVTIRWPEGKKFLKLPGSIMHLSSKLFF